MAGLHQLVVFDIEDQQFALDLSNVERIVRAVEVTHLPEAPDTILGVINFEGRVIPVVNSRRRLGLPERDLELDDLFIIARTDGRTLALAADAVRPVFQVDEPNLVASDKVLGRGGFVKGVAKVDDGMIVVLSVEKTLSFDEQTRVYPAIDRMKVT